MNITIPGPIPSKKNSLRRIMRGSQVFTVPSSNFERWNKMAFDKLSKTAGLVVANPKQTQPGLNPQSKVTIIFYFPDKRRRDLTNGAESIMDLLVDLGVLYDDCWQAVPELLLQSGGIDRERPRAEVTIQ